MFGPEEEKSRTSASLRGHFAMALHCQDIMTQCSAFVCPYQGCMLYYPTVRDSHAKYTHSMITDHSCQWLLLAWT
jgi:hypothetical protein